MAIPYPQKIARWNAFCFGVLFLLSGVYVCFRRIEAYNGEVGMVGHLSLNLPRELTVWMIAVLFITSGVFLLRAAKRLATGV
jgi:hypothetical protein